PRARRPHCARSCPEPRPRQRALPRFLPQRRKGTVAGPLAPNAGDRGRARGCCQVAAGRLNALNPGQEPGMSITENQILDALRAVRDPERGGDIVSLGMVSGVVIRDGNVGFAIEVEAERGPRLEPLRKAAERAIEALPDVVSVTAVLTAEARPPGGARGGAAQPARAQPGAAQAPGAGQALAPGVRAIVAVASGKGGVGKSTVAA